MGLSQTAPIALIATILALALAQATVPASAQSVPLAAPAGDLAVRTDLAIVQLDARIQGVTGIEPRLQTQLTPAQQLVLLRVRQLAAQDPASPELAQHWTAFVDSGGLAGLDVAAVVQWTMRDAYVQQVQDLRFRAQRLKAASVQMQALRAEIERIRVHDCRGNDCPAFQTNARALTTSFGSAFLTREADIAAYRAELDSQLDTVGDDGQLANLDLQNALQRQQQALQTISNVSKMMHDTAMAVIRNIGG